MNKALRNIYKFVKKRERSAPLTPRFNFGCAIVGEAEYKRGNFSNSIIHLAMALHIAPVMKLFLGGLYHSVVLSGTETDDMPSLLRGITGKSLLSKLHSLKTILIAANEAGSQIAMHPLDYDFLRYRLALSISLKELGYVDYFYEQWADMLQKAAVSLPQNGDLWKEFCLSGAYEFVTMGDYPAIFELVTVQEYGKPSLSADAKVLLAYAHYSKGNLTKAKELISETTLDNYETTAGKRGYLQGIGKLQVLLKEYNLAAKSLGDALGYFDESEAQRVAIYDIKLETGRALMYCDDILNSERYLLESLMYFKQIYVLTPPLSLADCTNVKRDIILQLAYKTIWDTDGYPDKDETLLFYSTSKFIVTSSKMLDLMKIKFGTSDDDEVNDRSVHTQILIDGTNASKMYQQAIETCEQMSDEPVLRKLKSLGLYVNLSDREIFRLAVDMWTICHRPHHTRILETYDVLIELYKKMTNTEKVNLYSNEKEKAIAEGVFMDNLNKNPEGNLWWKMITTVTNDNPEVDSEDD